MTHTENWTPLSDIGHVDRGNPKPRSIRFPDGWSKSFSTAPRYGGGWINILRATTEWLVKTGRLTEENARIRHRDLRDFWIVFDSTEKYQPSGNRIRRPEHIDSGVYINNNWEAHHCVSGAMGLLERFGVDTNKVLVDY